MSYVNEIYEKVVAKNPSEPEFHQAIKEVLDSIAVVIEANEEEYRKLGLLERLVEPERLISFPSSWLMIMVRYKSTRGSRYSLTAPLDLIRAAFVSTLRSIRGFRQKVFRI